MSVFSSLTNRIFFAAALLALLSITIAIYIVNRAVTRQAESELQRGITEAAALVADYQRILFDAFGRDARLIADLPYLKAAVDTHDPRTVKPIAEDQATQLATAADLFVIVDGKTGQVLARLGTIALPDAALTSVAPLRRGEASDISEFWPEEHGILLIRSVPILAEPHSPEVLGTLVLGANLDARQAARFKTLTDSDIAFGMNGRIEAATLPPDTWPALVPLLDHPGVSSQIVLNGERYFAFTNLLGPGATGRAMSIVLRSQTEQVRFLQQLHTEFAATAVFAVLLATLLSYGIARTVTRPVEAVTSTMREMTSSGDLTPRIPVPADSRWHDEDARLLATTFNSMTDAIQRFQREATQRERLSSLGRLSTVIAHEIRNPLMIIKTSLRALRRDEVTPAQVESAARDIDEEITRLNRIVSEVLDFARPIKFELAHADLNALVEDAVRAASPDGPTSVRVSLDRSIPPITTDVERLRQALVNILGNAQQAVAARGTLIEGEPVRLKTTTLAGRVIVVVADQGVGIAPEDLPRVFDPYFTTRRTGTGIGLAITRNIIEGLGGRISVSSQRDRGTEVRIELPIDAVVT